MSQTPSANEVVIQTADEVSRTITRIAHEILEKNPGDQTLAVVGIHTRGAFLGERLHKLLCEIDGCRYQSGELDISFYRDDVTGVVPTSAHPIVKDTNLPFEIDGARIVLVDDVLYTGRTIRAAIDALFDYGRPASIQLAVLIDRGHRELPIRPDYVGKNLPTSSRERISVRLSEYDDADQVVLVRPQEA